MNLKFLIFLKITKKHCFFVILFFVINQLCNAQPNLVKNGGFEQYSICPNLINSNYSFSYPNYWYLCTNQIGASYNNSCSTDYCGSVPYNCIKSIGNYQPSFDGQAYIYLDFINAGFGNDGRSYMQTQLKDSLRAGHRYYAEFFVNLPNTMRFACNNNGLLFTNSAVYVDTINFPLGLLAANPQIIGYGNPIVTDTFGWVKISGIYKAIGGEQYITLGNFKHDSNTIAKDVNPAGYYGSGYIIDDVSVIPLDSFCLKANAGRDTTINVGDSVFIGSLTNGLDSVKWYANGTTLIDSTRPGFWVTPTTTGSYFYVLQQVVNGCFSADTVYINVVLPLKFINYALRQAQGDKVENSWITANEINVSHFNIQRSSNGKDFVTIGTLKANDKNYNEYSFIDDAPNEGVNYYRIVSVDKDGKTSYSEVRIIEVQGTKYELRLFPNPAKDVVNIECKEGIKEVKIIDCLGREISHFVRNDGNIHHLSLNIHHYPKGLYVVQVITKKGEVFNEKLVVE